MLWILVTFIELRFAWRAVEFGNVPCIFSTANYKFTYFSFIEVSYSKKVPISYPDGFWQLQMFSCDEWNNLPIWYYRKFILLFSNMTWVDLTEKNVGVIPEFGESRGFYVLTNNHDWEIHTIDLIFILPSLLVLREIKYSCNNITTTWIQISRLFLFWPFLQN